MTRIATCIALLAITAAPSGVVSGAAPRTTQPALPTSRITAENRAPVAGSSSCRECHERFYGLWASSHHGLAMQPYSEELARSHLAAAPTAISIG